MENNTKDIFITRIFNAPRDLVFKAWTDPEQLLKWYAPQGCTLYFKQIDIREGSGFHSCISTPDYGDCWCIGTYHEIIFPERIVHSIVSADEAGNIVKPADLGMDPEWPGETMLTVTFEDADGKTKITLHQTAPETVAKRTGAYPSWLNMLDRLEEELRLS